MHKGVKFEGLRMVVIRNEKGLPGKPVAYDNGLLCMYCGLLWGIVACYFRLLGVPGRDVRDVLDSVRFHHLVQGFLRILSTRRLDPKVCGAGFVLGW